MVKENVSTSPRDGNESVLAPSDWMSSLYPEFEEARARLADVVWGGEGLSLPLKIRELIAVVVLAHRAYPTIETHMWRALEAGATFREIVEALQTVSVPGGHPCLHFAMPHLKGDPGQIGQPCRRRPNRHSFYDGSRIWNGVVMDARDVPGVRGH